MAAHFAKVRGDEANAGGDAQKELDVIAEEAIIEKLKLAPVAFLGSEEARPPFRSMPAGSLVVAVDRWTAPRISTPTCPWAPSILSCL